MGTWRHVALLLLVTLVVSPLAGAVEAADDVPARFSSAVALLNAGKFAEALPLLRELAIKAPDRPGIFWNLGIAATAVGEKQVALDAWLHYRDLKPDDVQAIPKVIQGYQALGMSAERDAQRERLVALRAALPASEKDKLAFYARDQFDAAGMHFVVLEYFEPHGPYGDLYRFEAVDSAHQPAYYFTIESDEKTTAVARQLGEIGKDERIYSLDKFEGRAHSTFRLMKALPPYDSLRTMVVDAAEGRIHPGAGSTH
jgi:tetratricopeptide (TPR) repeat protein